MALLDFERFGITSEDAEKNKYSYIIGFDLGDGEVAVAYWDLMDNGFIRPVDLNFDKNDNKKLLSGLFIEDDGKVHLGTVGTISGLNNAKGDLYTNFKIPPLRLKAGEKYENSDKTNLELMQTLLHEVIKKVHDNTLEDKFYHKDGTRKKGILAIGCPSSPEWTTNGLDVEYANMLQPALEQCPLDLKIVIMPESRASLIKVYKENSIDSKIRNGVIVVDNGSSTLDTTIIDFIRNVQYDFSVPLGAHLIERGILSNAVRRFNKREADIKGGINSAVFVRLHIRGAKELYFTCPSGSYNAHIEYANEICQKITLSRDTMPEITHKEVIKYSTKSEGTVEGTWADLHKKFVLRCLEQVGGCFSPDNYEGVVILTGGASKMDFIEEYIKKIFKNASIVVDPEPSYCVSRGLAWAVYTDLKALQLIEKVKKRMSVLVSSVLTREIAKQLSPIIYEYTKDELGKWAETLNNESTKDFVRKVEKEFLNTDTTEGKKRCNSVDEAIKNAVTVYLEDSSASGLRTSIINIVNDTFSTTFPGRVNENDIPKFVITDEDWNLFVEQITDRDLKISSTLRKIIEKVIQDIIKKKVSYYIFMVLNLLNPFISGNYISHLEKLYVEKKELSIKDRQKVYNNVNNDENKVKSDIEKELEKTILPASAKEKISNQILDILNSAIDNAVDKVSIYF